MDQDYGMTGFFGSVDVAAIGQKTARQDARTRTTTTVLSRHEELSSPARNHPAYEMASSLLLGDGIPLFPPPYLETDLELLSCKQYSTGLVQVFYGVK